MQMLSRILKLWLPLLVICVGSFLAYNNRANVHLDLWPWISDLELPGFVMYMGFFFFGFGVMGIQYIFDSVRKGLKIRRLTKRLRELDPEFDDAQRKDARDDAPMPRPSGPSVGLKGLQNSAGGEPLR